jgi:uncharacterized RDD family membrane protein YckC
MIATSDSVRVGDTAWGLLSPWWRRVVAELIDLTFVAVIANGLLFIMGEHPWWYMHGGHVVSADIIAREFTVALAALLYYPMLMVHTDGQTLGKKVLGIRVVRTDGNHMSLSRAAWREVALKFVLLGLVGSAPLVGLLISELLFWADGLWPLWDRENRALHDMLAGTRVVRV